jgi:cephalosporin hydroxylase
LGLASVIPAVEAMAVAESMAREAKRVVVIEDSTHEFDVVLSNIKVH